MKKFLLIFAFVFIVQIGYAQIDSLYLGQTPPESTPQLFSDNLMLGNSAYIGHRIAISLDGKEIYFSSRDSFNDPQIIQFLKYENNQWNGPSVLFPGFPFDQTAPAFSIDGNRLYFHSIENNKTLTYFVERDSSGWTTPQLYKGYTKELFYFQETNNNNFYATTNYAVNGLGGNDICKIIISGDTISEVRGLGMPLNTNGSSETSFYIAKDESYIVLGRNEDFTKLNRDLYISYKRADFTWTNPKSLGPKINTGNVLKWGPYVTSDNKYLFYESDEIRWTAWWVRFDNLLDSLRNTNFAPYVKNTIPDQTAIQDSMFSYQIPDSTFFDDDGNHTLTYTATIRSVGGQSFSPTWCSFDSLTRTISGIPSDEASSYKVTVTAKDTAGANVSDEFRLIIESLTDIENNTQKLPGEFKLNQNYPNPFNPATTIEFDLPLKSFVTLKIFDALGREVATLISQELSVGNHKQLWNAEDLQSGVYFYRIEAGMHYEIKKLLLLK